MYEAFFKLRERPFTAAPSAERYFPATAIENARKTLARSIERAEGAGLIIGPTGTGKTLLCMVLAHEFQDRFATVLLSSGRLCTRRALLQAILFELGLPYRGMEEGELRLALIDHLSPARQTLSGLLLLIDEAHALPWRLLEELRMISNLVRDGKPRVRLVLAGSPLLEERFANPKLESFSQRLAARCYLESLDRSETLAYVRAEIAAAGGESATILSDAALDSVYRATDGIPRLINQVCDHALILAELGGSPSLTPAIVEEAWADLQQLPTPWQQGEKRPAGEVVEFGGLDEARERPDDEREFIPFRTAEAAAVETPNPDQHFDRIQAQLAEIEDDFQPAGSIGPEVELVFQGLRDPFGESFQEEEVVLDRYASLDADVFGHRPQVSSREGRELSALLGPYIHKTAEADPQSELISEDTASAADDLEPAEVDAAIPAENPYSVRSQPNSEVAAQAAQDRRSVSRFAAGVERFPEPDDSDLIVVEDGWLESLAPARPAPLVRRQEYRQLFAKLRRG